MAFGEVEVGEGELGDGALGVAGLCSLLRKVINSSPEKLNVRVRDLILVNEKSRNETASSVDRKHVFLHPLELKIRISSWVSLPGDVAEDFRGGFPKEDDIVRRAEVFRNLRASKSVRARSVLSALYDAYEADAISGDLCHRLCFTRQVEYQRYVRTP
ncbi:unnamed protein product [Toxocara canis]|uniref:Reverse transcriptase n=1 Tax=Toxocara canis TaxID=6265 RepID=A0A183UIG9_TOXCA|nr:unnamed protein product [Toxocara canis]